jgi:hypothetical protein
MAVAFPQDMHMMIIAMMMMMMMIMLLMMMMMMMMPSTPGDHEPDGPSAVTGAAGVL